MNSNNCSELETAKDHHAIVLFEDQCVYIVGLNIFHKVRIILPPNKYNIPKQVSYPFKIDEYFL